MKKLINCLFISLIFTNSIHAFGPDTPESVSLFCQMIDVLEEVTPGMGEEFPDFKALTLQQRAEKVSQKYGETSEMAHWYKRAQNELFDLRNQIINDNLVLAVPYGYREYFPEEFQVLRLEELSPINNLEQRILAIGGTLEEIQILSQHGFSENDFCTINVMHSARPHYLADMSIAEHMAPFEDKFKTAFARAIPCSKDSLEIALKNIASSLNNDGIFIANMQLSNSIEEVSALLTKASFLSFKIFAIDDNSGCKFIASRAQMSPEELEVLVTNDQRLNTLLNYVFLKPEFNEKSSSVFSWCSIL